MKSLLFSLLIALAAAVTAAADNPPISGQWNIHNNIAGNESDMACTLTQTDTDLTGSCAAEKGSVQITGKVNGAKVNWVYKSEYNGAPITLTYKGALDADNKITGQVVVEEYSAEGEFTATQVK